VKAFFNSLGEEG